MPQKKRAEKPNNEALTINDNNSYNKAKKDDSYNPLDALSDKFIDLNELRQRHRGPPPKGILELELEALVFEDLYNSKVEVSRNAGQKNNVPKITEKLQESTNEDEGLETPTEKKEKEDIPEVSFI
jgi:hypothetical protein